MLEHWKDKRFTLIISQDILSEIRRVLSDFKIKMPESMIQEWIDVMASNSLLVDPVERIQGVELDPSDNKFLEAAVAGKANYIITQDYHLLRLLVLRMIRIMKPEEFNQILK